MKQANTLGKTELEIILTQVTHFPLGFKGLKSILAVYNKAFRASLMWITIEIGGCLL